MAERSELYVNIKNQQDLAEKIKELQSQEKKLRASILKELFGTEVIGTTKTQVDDIIVTGNFGLTYKFNQDEIEEALDDDVLSEEAKAAVRTKFDLDKKAYDNLDDETSAELDEFLVIKPSLPSIKVKFVADEDEE